MKKLYSVILILFVFAQYSTGQSITSFHPTLDYSGPENVNIASHAEITNSSLISLDVLCERYLENLIPGHYSYFCWIVCYDTSVDISPSPITLAPGASANTFEGWVTPSNLIGYDEVTYRYYDMNGNSDTLYLTFNYTFGATGIKDMTVSKYAMQITGANPASGSTLISYVTPEYKDAKIVVSNLLGSKVTEIRLNSKANTVTLPVSTLKAGIYICSLQVNGNIKASRKLVVSN